MEISIERTTESGYEDKVYPVKEALHILNTEIENGRSVWIDNKLFGDQIVTEDCLTKCKKVCVTNKLIGG
jgi:hypothetical protein